GLRWAGRNRREAAGPRTHGNRFGDCRCRFGGRHRAVLLLLARPRAQGRDYLLLPLLEVSPQTPLRGAPGQQQGNVSSVQTTICIPAHPRAEAHQVAASRATRVPEPSYLVYLIPSFAASFGSILWKAIAASFLTRRLR